MSKPYRPALTVLLVASVLLLGCSDDDSGQPQDTDSIDDDLTQVDRHPDQAPTPTDNPTDPLPQPDPAPTLIKVYWCEPSLGRTMLIPESDFDPAIHSRQPKYCFVQDAPLYPLATGPANVYGFSCDDYFSPNIYWEVTAAEYNAHRGEYTYLHVPPCW